MAEVVITLKIMPESPETDLNSVEEKVKEKIVEFGGEVVRVMQEPVAFGLIALKMDFVMDESKGDTEPLEESIKEVVGVAGVEVVGVTRTLG